MNIQNEQKLAIKISLFLLFTVFFISWFFQYLNYYKIVDFSWNRWNNKYIIFFISSFIIYFISLKLAKLTTKSIKESNEKLKTYNHNIAHEIKNPLAVLKSNLELLEISYDKELILSSYEEIAWIEKIINSLLFLSENFKNNSSSTINFSEILSDYKENKNINLVIKSDFVFIWDKSLFEILCKNIIENWLKYSENEKIDIFVNKDFITFENKSIYLKKEDLKNLFDIFYKWPNSNKNWSYGIWLSIVKKICDFYKINISLELENDIFKVILKR